MQSHKIPDFFQSILWSYDVSRLDPQEAMRTIIVQTINYGEWRHWQWIAKVYGKNTVRDFITEIPASEFRPEARALAAAIFGVTKIKYASRGAYIRAQKSLAEN